MAAATSIAFRDGDAALELSAAWQVPAHAVAIWIVAHGAGAPFDHATMRAIADAAERAGIATVRFNFPFTEAGRRRTDPPAIATAAIAAAVDAARLHHPDLDRYAGGHSFGGRMAMEAAARGMLDVRGLIFASFPLHPAGRPGTARAAHLRDVSLPMLFVSGTRDALAERALLEAEVAKLPHARLHWLDAADHGYRVLKRARCGQETGRLPSAEARKQKVERDVFDELAGAAREFIDET